MVSGRHIWRWPLAPGTSEVFFSTSPNESNICHRVSCAHTKKWDSGGRSTHLGRAAAFNDRLLTPSIYNLWTFTPLGPSGKARSDWPFQINRGFTRQRAPATVDLASVDILPLNCATYHSNRSMAAVCLRVRLVDGAPRPNIKCFCRPHFFAHSRPCLDHFGRSPGFHFHFSS